MIVAGLWFAGLRNVWTLLGLGKGPSRRTASELAPLTQHAVGGRVGRAGIARRRAWDGRHQGPCALTVGLAMKLQT